MKTAKHKKKRIKAFVKYLRSSIHEDDVSDLLDELGPTWERPSVFLHTKESGKPKLDGLYISLTEEEEFTRVLPWKLFVKDTLESDDYLLESFLPHLKKLVSQIEKRIKLNNE